VCKLAFAIIHSTMIALPMWREACKQHEMRAWLIPRDVRTCWNSVYDMLSVAVTYKEVINSFTGDWDLGYRKYNLSNAQWSLLEDMLHILKVFKDATLYFSNENHCTITQVLTTMDKIDDLITVTVVTSSVQPGGALKCALHPSIKSALKLAKATLNKHYSHTDTSNVYRIAMGKFG
ncbi:hypothetical protein B0H10DRAFT_1778808, partial [Mycena sp. CBHHK59/15]